MPDKIPERTDKKRKVNGIFMPDIKIEGCKVHFSNPSAKYCKYFESLPTP